MLLYVTRGVYILGKIFLRDEGRKNLEVGFIQGMKRGRNGDDGRAVCRGV